MIFRDNLILLNDEMILFMNINSLRRKKVQYKYKDLVLSMINKEKKNKDFNKEEQLFIKELKEEKQILDKDLSSLLEKELLTHYQSSINDAIIEPTIILTYDCNSNCVYCYQKEKGHFQGTIDTNYIDKIDEFYDEYSKHFPIKKEFDISITGGEPLLRKNIPIIQYISRKWSKARFKIATNGINLSELIGNLPVQKIKAFKISLDGIKSIHNNRRPMLNGNISFDKTVQGIQIAIELGIPVELKITIDSSSILNISGLLDFLEDRGWLDNPLISIGLSSVFSFTEGIDLDKKFNSKKDIINKYVQAKKCDKRIRRIKSNLIYGIGSLRRTIMRESNERMLPMIYRCENQFVPNYIFDPSGNVYFCMGVIGNEKGIVGTYNPKVYVNKELISQMRERHVYNIKECKQCSYKFLCRGGCPASVILNDKGIMQSECGFYKDEYVTSKLGEILL